MLTMASLMSLWVSVSSTVFPIPLGMLKVSPAPRRSATALRRGLAALTMAVSSSFQSSFRSVAVALTRGTALGPPPSLTVTYDRPSFPIQGRSELASMPACISAAATLPFAWPLRMKSITVPFP